MLRPNVVSVGGYYRVTFRLFYVVAMLLAIYSNVASLPVILLSTILGIAALTRITLPLQRKPLTRHILYTILPILMCAVGFFSFTKHNDYFLAIAEALCGIAPAFVYIHNRPRGYWLSVLTMVVLGLGALLLAERVEAYALFIAMLLVAVFNLNAANLYFLARDKRELGEGLPPKYFYLLLRTIPVAVVVAAVIFAVFPRMRALAISFGDSRSGNQVGYTDSISLMGGGVLNETSTVAFWVESENKHWLAIEGPQLLFRGNSLEKFDGSTWVGEVSATRPIKEVMDVRLQSTHTAEAINLKIFRERSSARALFAPQVLQGISLPPQIADNVVVDLNRNIALQRPDIGRYTYELLIAPSTLNGSAESPTLEEYTKALGNLDTTDNSREIFSTLSFSDKQALTSIPAKIGNAEWFTSWVNRVGTVTPDMQILSVLKQITKMFRAEYKTSLENSFNSEAALEDFLINKKEGHCEYFVSASVMYLRSHGIPARAVSGYRGGIFNIVTHLLEVQEKHAHAWVEFWWPGVGWVNYDPTPFQVVTSSPNILSDLKHYISAVNFWFYRYVVDFNPETQRELAESLIAIDFRKLFDFKSFTLDAAIKELSILAICFIATIWVLVRVLRRKDEFRGLPRFYLGLANKTKSLGFHRNHCESFRAYHLRLINSGFSRNAILAFDRALESSIYAEKKFSGTQYKELKGYLKQLKKPEPGAAA